jgi:uncharacterized protein (DUF488 family)
MPKYNLYTIGFTKKNAEAFFGKLKRAGIKKVIDIRLNNESQLAGFTKKDDLRFFLRALLNCDYRHDPNWAPTKEILDDYKNNKIDWIEYEMRFKKLIDDRKIEDKISAEDLDGTCLLCSEPTPEKCHRRLVAEYLKKKLGDIDLNHI